MRSSLRREGKPMSGRIGGYVYSWFNGRLHWPRYVVPKRAATKAWSEHQSLTGEQRDA